MELIHTSPAPISTINSNGRFGDFLFFAAAEYVMTAAKGHVTYSLEQDEDRIIDAEQMFYHENAAALAPLVERVMGMVGCDEDTAEELIAQRTDVHAIDANIEAEDLAEVSWDIQRITGEAAVALGFQGVSMNDEQGRAMLIKMTGREGELALV